MTCPIFNETIFQAYVNIKSDVSQFGQTPSHEAEVDVQIIKRWILAALRNPPSFLLLNCIKHLNDSSSKIINARLKAV